MTTTKGTATRTSRRLAGQAPDTPMRNNAGQTRKKRATGSCADLVRNPATGRCVRPDGPTGKKLAGKSRAKAKKAGVKPLKRSKPVSKIPKASGKKRKAVSKVRGQAVSPSFLLGKSITSTAPVWDTSVSPWNAYGSTSVTTSVDPRKSRGGVAWSAVSNDYVY